jgi:hypothetical protein
MDLQSRIRDLKTTVPATNGGVVPGNSPLSFLAPEEGNWVNSFETRFELGRKAGVTRRHLSESSAACQAEKSIFFGRF